MIKFFKPKLVITSILLLIAVAKVNAYLEFPTLKLPIESYLIIWHRNKISEAESSSNFPHINSIDFEPIFCPPLQSTFYETFNPLPVDVNGHWDRINDEICNVYFNPLGLFIDFLMFLGVVNLIQLFFFKNKPNLEQRDS